MSPALLTGNEFLQDKWLEEGLKKCPPSDLAVVNSPMDEKKECYHGKSHGAGAEEIKGFRNKNIEPPLCFYLIAASGNFCQECTPNRLL